MDSRKLERIVIIILLLLNLFLLFVVLSEDIAANKSERQLVQSVTAFLEENGITVGGTARLVQLPPPACTIVRELQTESNLVKAIIGKSSCEDLGGNILFYRSKTGQAALRGSGETDVLFSGSSVPVWGSLERTAMRVMRNTGIETRVRRSDADSVELYCCWNACPIYNAVLSFSFADDALFMITGTRAFDRETAQDAEGLLDSVSVLLRFVELCRSEGRVCSRLDSIEPGYLMQVTASGEGELAPVWRIETDTGVMLVNARSGHLEQTVS